MNADVRRKLEMADRVRDFARAQAAVEMEQEAGREQEPDAPRTAAPSDGYAAAVARLEEQLARAKRVAEQQVAGRRDVTAAVLDRSRLRLDIREAVAVLAGIAAAASAEAPDLLAGVTRSLHGVSGAAFVARARAAHSAAVAHQPLLTRYGLPATFAESLGALIERFEAASQAKHAGQAAQTGASAELAAVTAELMRTVKQLDALYRYRYRGDAERLGAWRSVRNLPWPVRRAAPGDQPPTEVKPAA
jgi:hypothetical protein